MAKGALFIHWGYPAPDLTAKALKLFAEATEYWKRKQNEKEIDSFEPFFLDYVGSDLNGFMLIRGDRESLARLRMDPEFVTHMMKANTLLPHYGVVEVFFGEELQRRFGDYEKALAQVT